MESLSSREARGGDNMDCCVCSPMAAIYRPPRNTICLSCYEGARSMISFLNEIDSNQEDGNSTNSRHRLQSNPTKGISNAFKRMKEMKEVEERMEEKLGFLGGLVVALRDELHTDIQVKPGNGPPIPAHKSLLATRSEIFRTTLGSDECKAPADDAILLPELGHEELRCLLEFLYCGTLPEDEAEKHAHSLLLAADKYDIPFLKKFCEHRILRSLDPSNALEVLEVSDVCSNNVLKKHAMNSIVKHMEDVIFSARYEAFALKNAHLCVEITRALLMEMNAKKDVSS